MLGFLTIAYGDCRYIQQATTLARSLRMHMPGTPIAVVTDRPEIDGFDFVVTMKPFFTAGMVHKLDLYEYSPFQETLFIDCDAVVVRSFHDQLAEIGNFDFSPVVDRYLQKGEHEHWLEDLGTALDGVGGSRFPKFNGGLYFFRKSKMAEEVFHVSKSLLRRKTELGIKDFDDAGPSDETLIGLALASLVEKPLHNDRGRLMRTPLHSTGNIRSDPFLGLSHFVKEGQEVSPAIVHYCGQFTEHPTYIIAAEGLRLGSRIKWSQRASIHGIYFFRKLGRKAGKILKHFILFSKTT